MASAREAAREVVRLAERTSDVVSLSLALRNLSAIENQEENFEQAEEAERELGRLSQRMDSMTGTVTYANNHGYTLLQLGRVGEAAAVVRAHVEELLRLRNPFLMVHYAETCAAIFGHQKPALAAEILGATEAMREREHLPHAATDNKYFEQDFSPIRASLTSQGWDELYRKGRTRNVEDLLQDLPEAGPMVSLR
jgi:hypothetical protein